MKRTLPTIAVAITALVLSVAPLLSQAAGQQSYEQKAFQAAQEAGKPVLVEIHADWCPTCKAQLPILNKLSGEAGFSTISRFRVDFDGQKNVVKEFKARMQSTLIVFKGKTEMGRSVGVTDEAKIRDLLAKAL